MRSISFTLSVVLLLFIGRGFAHANDAITWEWCLSEARRNNPVLASAHEDVLQAKRDEDISLSAVLPEVSGSLSASRAKRGGAGTSDAFSYGLSARQMIFDGYRTSSDIMRSSDLLRAQWYNYELVSSNIRLDLRLAFIDLLRAQKLLDMSEDIARRRRQNHELVKLRYQGGREHRGALLTAEADLAQAELEIDQAKRSIILTSRRLLKQLGLSKELPLTAEDEFTLSYGYLTKPDLEDIADNTPFLRELVARKDAAGYGLRTAESDFLPKVFLTGSLGRSGDSWAPRNNDWAGGVSVSVPVFEGTRRFAELSKARSRLSKATYETISGRDSVLVSLERSWKELQDSIARVSVREKFLAAARERAEITAAQYSAGLVSFNDWIIIEDNLARARKSHLEARADVLAAEAYWFQARGGTLEDE